MKSNKEIIWRTYLVYILMLLFGAAIIIRIAYIQIAEGAEWKAKAKEISLRYFNVEAMRGNVFDANGKFLATSIPLFETRINLSPKYLSDSLFTNNVDSLSFYLAELLKNKTAREYKQDLVSARKKGNGYFLIKRNVTYEQLTAMRKFPIFRKKDNSGSLQVIAQSKRILPFGDLAFRTIGWDKEGETNDIGIEGAFSDTLEGVSGKKLYQRFPGGEWIPLNNSNEIDPRNGKDIHCTIDIGIQDVAEDALLRQLEANDADHGCVVLMEVKTGKVKAIANLGKTKEGTYREVYNYAIGESSEPGSTFKLFSLLAAFEDGKTDLKKTVDCTGGVAKYSNRTMRDSHMGTGVLTVQQVFEKSSNVGTSKVITQAYNSNPQQFIDRLYGFGLKKPLGLEIKGEGSPQLKDTKSKFWSAVSLPWISIGYEVALTPLQILTFYNAVANNGVMVKPQFISEICDAGIPSKKFEPIVLNPKIASEPALKMAQTMLMGVVDHGTGTALKNPVYKVAGKTGTAQISQGKGGYNKTNYKASFVGYFPANNPKYSCIVVINNPSKGAYYGGAISAPVFREIADRVYATDPDMGSHWADSINGVFPPPVKGGYQQDIARLFSLSKSPFRATTGDWLTNQTDTVTQTNLLPLQTASCVIPNVKGMGARDALFLLEKLGFKVKLNGCGLVKSQSLPAGAKVSYGSLVQLDLEV